MLNCGLKHVLAFSPFPSVSSKGFSVRDFKTVCSQFAQSHFAHSNFARIFPVCPVLFSPFPTSPFSHSAQYLSCPFAVSPNFIFAHFSFRPEDISPNFPISPNDHFALFTQDPSHFAQIPFFLISGRKSNKKFS